MRLWHAIWSSQGFLALWGENAMRASSHDELSASGQHHPFCCTPDELADDLTAFDFISFKADSIEILLPTVGEVPVPSPGLVSPNRDLTDEAITLRSWGVTALLFSPEAAVNLLTSVAQELPSGVRLDDSFKYWMEVTKLLLELLTRGRFLPGLELKNNEYHALWHIIPTEEQDVTRLAVLAKSMPPICRALVGANQSETLPPHVLIESFVAQSADVLIRGFSNQIAEQLPPDESSKPRVGRQWLKALTSKDSIVEAPLYDLIKLDARLKRWNQSVVLGSPHVVRLCFSLVPPRGGDFTTSHAANKWKLLLGLQSTTNPEQIIPAADVWNGDIGFLRFSEYTAEELHDTMLKGLARAAHSFPLLDRALAAVFPEDLSIDTEEAYDFLKNASIPLEEAGFGVVIPEWWNSKGSQLGLHLRIDGSDNQARTAREVGSFGLSQLVSFSWQVALGDQVMEIDEFRALVREQSPLVEIDGRWVEVQSSKIESALEFIEKQKSENKMKLLEALRLGLGAEAENIGLEVVGFDATGWLSKLLREGDNPISVIPQPHGFNGVLRHYQEEGLAWLHFLSSIGCGACLADDMGLGKTIQLLALLLTERESSNAAPPTLLIAPMSIIDNWYAEARRFAPELRVLVHHGSFRHQGEAFVRAVKESDLVLTTYGLAARDEALMTAVDWGRIALDEAQHIKNVTTKQSRAVRRLAKHQLQRSTDSTLCHRVVLTGTPIENHLSELWSIFDFLNPGYLGTLSEFRTRFALPIERYRDNECAQRLSRVIRPFFLRRLKTDEQVINDLPEKIEMDVFTTLSAEQAALYQACVEEMLPQVEVAEGVQRKGLVLATITKLKQICNHPGLVLKDDDIGSHRSGKVQRLIELLEVILDEGDRVLVFTQYVQMGRILKTRLEEIFGTEVAFLHGGLSKKARSEMVERFQREDGPRIFLLSLRVGGLGLNLTAANQVIHFDQWWNPAVEEQATDRAFRIGQKRNVQVRRFICRGTLEERIAELVQHKRDLADRIVGSTKSMISDMSVDELRELLSLQTLGISDDEEDEDVEEVEM